MLAEAPARRRHIITGRGRRLSPVLSAADPEDQEDGPSSPRIELTENRISSLPVRRRRDPADDRLGWIVGWPPRHIPTGNASDQTVPARAHRFVVTMWATAMASATDNEWLCSTTPMLRLRASRAGQNRPGRRRPWPWLFGPPLLADAAFIGQAVARVHDLSIFKRLALNLPS